MAKKPTSRKAKKKVLPRSQKKRKSTAQKLIVGRIAKAENGDEYFDYLSSPFTTKNDLIDNLEEEELQDGDIVYEMIPTYIINKGTIHVTPHEKK